MLMEIKIIDLPMITVIGKEGLCGCSWHEKFRWDICWILGSNE